MLGLGAGAVARLFVPSIREAETGREYEGYTVTRMLLNLLLRSTSGSDRVLTCGMIIQQEDVLIGSVLPDDDPHADWLWHEEFVVGVNDHAPHALISRDIRSQRIARGREACLSSLDKDRS